MTHTGGGTSAWVNQIRKQRGLPVETEPAVYPDVVWLWNAFMHLSRRRPVGFGGALPITMEAIEAYCRFKSIPETKWDFFFTCIDQLDTIWLDHQEEEQEKDKKRKDQERRHAQNAGKTTRTPRQ